MTKRLIKKLATASFTNENLSFTKINRIVKFLNRSELKAYIKDVKNYRDSKTIILITSKLLEKDRLIKDLNKLFPDKKILLKEDKSLIAGIKIINKDIIYESNIKNTLQNLVSFINN